MQHVGFVGLGKAGWPMATQIVTAGHDLVVSDADASLARRFAAETGARAATGPADFAGVEVLFTMLPHDGVVREVLFGEGGIAEHLAAGSIVIDTSSSNPLGTREIAAQLAQRGIAMVDSAVSEARVGDAKRGGATFMVGADEETFERVRPLLELNATRIFRVGPSGAGHAMKTLNNFISASGLHAALDALIAAHKYGIDPMRMLDAFNVSTGRNLSTEGTMKYKALPRRFDRSYSLEHLAKDMGIAAGLAEEVGYESPMFGLLVRAFAAARDDIGGEEDLTASLQHWEHVAGVQLPAAEMPE